MKGAYVLLIDIEKRVCFSIQSLGSLVFDPGKWVYVGSAMGDGSTNIENRLKRHFRSDKTVYWHIDHLLEKDVLLSRAYWAESSTHVECEIAQEFETGGYFEAGPKQFGASDCKSGCSAHIFRMKRNTDAVIEHLVISTFQKLGLTPSLTTDGNVLSVS
ncbi:MAG: DUF123 domain-containing protein [Candidatus Thorarchaeota archaeon]